MTGPYLDVPKGFKGDGVMWHAGVPGVDYNTKAQEYLLATQ